MHQVEKFVPMPLAKLQSCDICPPLSIPGTIENLEPGTEVNAISTYVDAKSTLDDRNSNLRIIRIRMREFVSSSEIIKISFEVTVLYLTKSML